MNTVTKQKKPLPSLFIQTEAQSLTWQFTPSVVKVLFWRAFPPCQPPAASFTLLGLDDVRGHWAAAVLSSSWRYAGASSPEAARPRRWLSFAPEEQTIHAVAHTVTYFKKFLNSLVWDVLIPLFYCCCFFSFSLIFFLPDFTSCYFFPFDVLCVNTACYC